VVIPLGYIGQKLGIVFAMLPASKTDAEQNPKIFSQEQKFLGISKEFAPFIIPFSSVGNLSEGAGGIGKKAAG